MAKSILGDAPAAPSNPDEPFSNKHPLLECSSSLHSTMTLSNFLFPGGPQAVLQVPCPPEVTEFQELFPSSPGAETKNDTYSSFDFDTQILLNEVKIIILQAVVKRCWRKQSVTHGDGEAPCPL